MYRGIFEEEFSKSNRYRVYLPPNKASLCWSLQTFQSSSFTSSANFFSPSIDVAASFNPAIDDLIVALRAPVMVVNFLINDSITFCAGEEAVAFDSGLFMEDASDSPLSDFKNLLATRAKSKTQKQFL